MRESERIAAKKRTMNAELGILVNEANEAAEKYYLENNVEKPNIIYDAPSPSTAERRRAAAARRPPMFDLPSVGSYGTSLNDRQRNCGRWRRQNPEPELMPMSTISRWYRSV